MHGSTTTTTTTTTTIDDRALAAAGGASVAPTPMPRIGAHDARVVDFRAALDRAELGDTGTIAPPRSMAQLMQMLTVLRLIGAPVPTWMIEAFRAAGLVQLADSLEVRNLRMDEQSAQLHAARVREAQVAARA